MSVSDIKAIENLKSNLQQSSFSQFRQQRKSNPNPNRVKLDIDNNNQSVYPNFFNNAKIDHLLNTKLHNFSKKGLSKFKTKLPTIIQYNQLNKSRNITSGFLNTIDRNVSTSNNNDTLLENQKYFSNNLASKISIANPNKKMERQLDSLASLDVSNINNYTLNTPKMRIKLTKPIKIINQAKHNILPNNLLVEDQIKSQNNSINKVESIKDYEVLNTEPNKKLLSNNSNKKSNLNTSADDQLSQNPFPLVKNLSKRSLSAKHNKSVSSEKLNKLKENVNNDQLPPINKPIKRKIKFLSCC